MSKKNCQYKIDFHVTFNGIKHSLSDLDRYGRSGHDRGPTVIVTRYYSENGKHKELTALIDKSAFHASKDYVRYFQKYCESETVEEFWKWMDEARKLEGNNQNWWNFSDVLGRALHVATKRTPEYLKMETDFQNWLKLRPGIVDAWAKFDTSRRANHNRWHFNSEEERKAWQEPLELNLHNFVCNRSDRRFREELENDRPLKFVTGQIVKLKDEYKGKKGKDPFKYNAELYKSVRLGVVAEQRFKGQHGNYGVGSRSINVMWFATGEETLVMERCLKLVKDEEMDRATASI